MALLRAPALVTCALLFVAGGCPASDDADVADDSATESTSAPTTETDPDTGTESSIEPTADTGDPTGGPGLPAECESADPMVSSRFLVELGDFPVDDEDLVTLEALACSVTDVQAEAAIVTTLQCEGPDATMHAIALELDATDAGDPVWQVGDAVVLDYRLLDDTELETGTYRWLSLRRDTGELLLGAASGDGILGGEFISSAPMGFSPIEVEIHDEACGYDILSADSELANLAVTFVIDDDELRLFGEHRGVLQSGDLRFAIDLATAEIGHCCHFLRRFRVVLRAVQ